MYRFLRYLHIHVDFRLFACFPGIGTLENADWFARCLPITCILSTFFQFEFEGECGNMSKRGLGRSLPPQVHPD